MRTLTGLENLRTAGRDSGTGGIDIQDNLYLEDVSALSSLEEVATSPVQLVNNPALQTLEGLEGVRNMRRLYIGACTSLTTLQPLLEGELESLESARITFNEMVPACEAELLLCEDRRGHLRHDRFVQGNIEALPVSLLRAAGRAAHPRRRQLQASRSPPRRHRTGPGAALQHLWARSEKSG